MFKIPVYKYEAEAGLVEQIQANASVAFLSSVQKAEITEANFQRFLAEGSEKFDMDTLYPTKSVLVSSTWNRNDDVFSAAQIWSARHTPVHKPTNINHDHNQIVGHITSTWVVDDQGESIAEDTVIDDLPDVIHICNGAVIYKHYKESDLVERALELIESIEANEKYVSMECLFPDFDYAVISPDSQNYTIARNEDTAFLTKHLRCYGGKGEFNGYRVGRLLKNMSFSGKGYVDKPANPDSVIFTDDKPNFNFSDATYKSSFKFTNGVDNTMSETSTMSAVNLDDSKEILMSETNDFYKSELEDAKKQIAELTESNKALQESVANAGVEQLKSQVADLTSEVETLSKDKETIATELAESKESIEELQTSLKEALESKEKLEEAVEAAKTEKLFASRVSMLIEAGLEKERAEETVNKFMSLNDEQFEAYLSSAKTLFGEYQKMSDEKDKKEKAKKEDAKASSEKLEDVLEDAEVEAGDDTGATEADDTATEREEVVAAMSNYFSQKIGLPSEDSDE